MGDSSFHKAFHRPDAGIQTVEGNVAGSRAAMLERKRQIEQEEFELEKSKRIHSAQNASLNITSRFQPARMGSIEEQSFKAKTVGLVTAEEFHNAAKESETSEIDTKNAEAALMLLKKADKDKKKSKKRKKEMKKMASLLSFQDNDGEEEEDDDDTNEKAAKEAKIKSSLKDPTVDTSFLPDKQREEEKRAERLRLEQGWMERQVAIRTEQLEITYSYWDGSGHRRSCVVTKGSSIGDFLEVVRQDLCKDFKELGTVASDALVYVKEDLILPHDITFYDLIVTKARGKSGPLFHFDVHDDIRIGPLDSRVEKDESHPGKVVERRWYERNKHIFPASRWEIYDPAKTYGTYTIGGGIVNKKK
jgi:protein FAM50